MPVNAEEPPEVLYEVNKTENRDQLLREEARNVQHILGNYLDRMQVADRLDNDIRYLLIKSRGLKGKELARYLEINVMPRNEELLQVASQVTTSSNVLRELNGMFIEYCTLRSNVLEELIGLGQIEIPQHYYQEFASASYGGFAYSSSSSAYVDKHVPPEVTMRMARVRALLGRLYSARSEYINRKAYIIRNKAELIREEK